MSEDIMTASEGISGHGKIIVERITKDVPGDGVPLGISDAEVCIAALRYHAGRHLRRLALAISGLVVTGISAAPVVHRR